MLRSSFYSNPAVKQHLADVERAVLRDEMSSFVGGGKLLDIYFASVKEGYNIPAGLN